MPQKITQDTPTFTPTTRIRPPIAEEPSVGIFWFVRDNDHIGMIVDHTPASRAEEYGDFATHATGHYAYWESLKRRGPRSLAHAGIPNAPAWYEYEEFPRGRIVYSRHTEQFTIYLDPKLKPADFVNLIVLVFSLPSGKYDVTDDAHYRSSQFLPAFRQVRP